jgi:hypothetical protein
MAAARGVDVFTAFCESHRPRIVTTGTSSGLKSRKCFYARATTSAIYQLSRSTWHVRGLGMEIVMAPWRSCVPPLTIWSARDSCWPARRTRRGAASAVLTCRAARVRVIAAPRWPQTFALAKGAWAALRAARRGDEESRRRPLSLACSLRVRSARRRGCRKGSAGAGRPGLIADVGARTRSRSELAEKRRTSSNSTWVWHTHRVSPLVATAAFGEGAEQPGLVGGGA